MSRKLSIMQKIVENLLSGSTPLNLLNKLPRILLIFSQLDYLIQVVDTNSNTDWQTVQIQISWLLKKPTDLDLHCLQKQGISLFSRTRVKVILFATFYSSSLIVSFNFKYI